MANHSKQQMSSSGRSRIRKVFDRLMAWIRRQPRQEPEPGLPMDPYAYVGAPKKPRPSDRSAAAVAELPEE